MHIKAFWKNKNGSNNAENLPSILRVYLIISWMLFLSVNTTMSYLVFWQFFFIFYIFLLYRTRICFTFFVSWIRLSVYFSPWTLEFSCFQTWLFIIVERLNSGYCPLWILCCQGGGGHTASFVGESTEYIYW